MLPAKKAMIESALESTRHILTTDFRYKVPLYQRAFSWTEEQISQLWNDIIASMDEDRAEYFLGTIVVEEKPEEKARMIIDGQQRLATLTMIFAAIRTIYQELDDERAAEVDNDYLGLKDRRTRITEPRLTLNETDQPSFQKLVIDKSTDAELETAATQGGIPPSNALLAKAALYLRTVVRDRTKAKNTNFLIDLEEYIRDRIVMILVVVGDEADAYTIFETLNDRGLDLSISDLLKNYVFSKAATRLNVAKTQWTEMAFVLGTQSHAQFLRHYWLSKYGVIRDRDLYKEIKQKFSSANGVINLMADLKDTANKYAAISNVDHVIWKEYGEQLRTDLEILQLFGLSQFRPLVLAALESMKEKEIAKLMRLIVVLSMRYSIIGSLGPGNIEKAFSDAAIQIRKGKTDTTAKVFAQLKHVYPDDDRFKDDFAHKSVTKAKLARYILRAIADQMDGKAILTAIEDEKITTLEHVMPQTRTRDWIKAAVSEDQYREYVNRLGNLTLMERTENRAEGSAPFAKKKIAYKNSELSLTRDLENYPDWTVREIEERQKKLAEFAVKVWSLPY